MHIFFWGLTTYFKVPVLLKICNVGYETVSKSPTKHMLNVGHKSRHFNTKYIDMKFKIYLIAVILSTFFSCTQNKSIRLIDNETNTWNYKNRFDIQLPQGFYLESSIIHNPDSQKIGEVVLDNELLISKLTGSDYLNLSKNIGTIKTDETSYTADCSECTFIKSDSILINTKQWYYIFEQMDYEGPDDDYGTWNAFEFAYIEKNKITLITFYNKKIDDFNLVFYTNILKSVDLK